MRRRDLLRGGALAAGSLALGPAFWRAAYSQPATVGDGPYGSLDGREPDDNGIILPEGFTSRVVARSGEAVPGTGYVWHTFPDGGATFPAEGGGWVYVSNSEVALTGGVGALRFDADGEVVDAYRILGDTSANCAGGPTPWGTWLSCEEYDLTDVNPGLAGTVWECDPMQEGQGEQRPSMGAFQHEAVCVDPDGERLYLTEDRPDGRLYRFTPSEWPDLSEGDLEVAVVDDDGGVTWLAVPDPAARSGPVRAQVPESTPFDGGEGIWFDSGFAYFTTKGDNRVWSLDVEASRLEVIYDAEATPDAPLRGVDNIVVTTRSGDIYVAEDGDDLQLVLITPEREVAPFLQVVGQENTELAGPAFDPSGTRLYFSSQRGNGGTGITYEVRGPFRQVDGAGGTTTTTLAGVGGSDGDGDRDAAADGQAGDRDAGGDDDEGLDVLPIAAAAGSVGALAAAATVWRVRNRRHDGGPPTP